MIQLFARRADESNAFSVPDDNALWSRAEDDLLVQAVAKHSTSDVLFRDWREVAWELTGHSEQQCKERYHLADTIVDLTFVFLRVIFRGSPFLPSSHVLTKDADSADSARPLHYSKSDRRVARAPALSPCSSLTHAHRSIGYRNRNPQPLAESAARLMYLRVYDSRDSSHQSAPSPSVFYSLTHAHSTLPTPTLLTITYTQVLWFLERLTRPTVSCCETTRTRLTVCLPAQPSMCEAF